MATAEADTNERLPPAYAVFYGLGLFSGLFAFLTHALILGSIAILAGIVLAVGYDRRHGAHCIGLGGFAILAYGAWLLLT